MAARATALSPYPATGTNKRRAKKLKQSLAQVISNSEVTPGVHLIWLEAPEIALDAKPGQFVMVRCGDDTMLRRPLSIHNVDEAKSRLALLFAVVGKGTKWLSQRKTGEIDAFGPLGNGFTIRSEAKKLLLVAGGIGIAPLAFLAEAAASRDRAVKLHQGATGDIEVLLDPLRTHSTLVPRPGAPASATPGVPAGATEFASAGTIECTASTANVSSRWPTGLATECIPGLAAWADQVFACGPTAMYRAMAQMVELKGKPVQVSLEVMMGCGVGVCYGCTIKTNTGLKQVCTDGPVFNLDDVLWDELVVGFST
jgi:dihydroorotate dehydrogenase electron transfer subunit